MKIQEEVNSLMRLGQHFDDQLKLASVELGDFSDDDLALLDKCAQYYSLLHIHDINLNYLRDFYCAKKRECIENRQTTVQQRVELQRILSSIEEATRDVVMLERYWWTNPFNSWIPDQNHSSADLMLLRKSGSSRISS